MTDNRRIYLVTKNIVNQARTTRRTGLGFFGWLGLLVWIVIGAGYCSHQANSQPGIPYHTQ